MTTHLKVEAITPIQRAWKAYRSRVDNITENLERYRQNPFWDMPKERNPFDYSESEWCRNQEERLSNGRGSIPIIEKIEGELYRAEKHLERFEKMHGSFVGDSTNGYFWQEAYPERETIQKANLIEVGKSGWCSRPDRPAEEQPGTQWPKSNFEEQIKGFTSYGWGDLENIYRGLPEDPAFKVCIYLSRNKGDKKGRDRELRDYFGDVAWGIVKRKLDETTYHSIVYRTHSKIEEAFQLSNDPQFTRRIVGSILRGE